jgi:hypothetical protein
MNKKLEGNCRLTFGDITIEDAGVILVKYKPFWASNERVLLPWNLVHYWNADGCFVIGKKGDKETFSSSSYINDWNTHLLEHLVSGGLKKGVRKLSDYLKD